MANQVQELLISEFSRNRGNADAHSIDSELDDLVVQCSEEDFALVPTEYKNTTLGLVDVLKPYHVLSLGNPAKKMLKDAKNNPELGKAFLNNSEAVAAMSSLENQFLLVLNTLSDENITLNELLEIEFVKDLFSELDETEYQAALIKAAIKSPTDAKKLFKTKPDLYDIFDAEEFFALAVTQEFAIPAYFEKHSDQINLTHCIVLLSAHPGTLLVNLILADYFPADLLWQIGQLQSIITEKDYDESSKNITELKKQLKEIVKLPKPILKGNPITNDVDIEALGDAIGVYAEDNSSEDEKTIHIDEEKLNALKNDLEELALPTNENLNTLFNRIKEIGINKSVLNVVKEKIGGSDFYYNALLVLIQSHHELQLPDYLEQHIAKEIAESKSDIKPEAFFETIAKIKLDNVDISTGELARIYEAFPDLLDNFSDIEKIIPQIKKAKQARDIIKKQRENFKNTQIENTQDESQLQSFADHVNETPVENLINNEETPEYYRHTVFTLRVIHAAQLDYPSMQTLLDHYPAKQPNNLMQWVVNCYFAGNRFCKEKIAEWINQDDFPEACKFELDRLILKRFKNDADFRATFLWDLSQGDEYDHNLLPYFLDTLKLISVEKEFYLKAKDEQIPKEEYERATALFTNRFYNVVIAPVINGLSRLDPLRTQIVNKLTKYITQEDANLSDLKKEITALLFKNARSSKQAKKNPYNNSDDAIYLSLINYVEEFSLDQIREFAGNNDNTRTLLHWFATRLNNPHNTEIARKGAELFSDEDTFPAVVEKSQIEPETASAFLAAYTRKYGKTKWPKNFEDTNSVCCQAIMRGKIKLNEIFELNQSTIYLIEDNEAVKTYHDAQGYESFNLSTFNLLEERSDYSNNVKDISAYYALLAHKLIKADKIDFNDSIQQYFFTYYSKFIIWSEVTEAQTSKLKTELEKAQEFFNSTFYTTVVSPIADRLNEESANTIYIYILRYITEKEPSQTVLIQKIISFLLKQNTDVKETIDAYASHVVSNGRYNNANIDAPEKALYEVAATQLTWTDECITTVKETTGHALAFLDENYLVSLIPELEFWKAQPGFMHDLSRRIYDHCASGIVDTTNLERSIRKQYAINSKSENNILKAYFVHRDVKFSWPNQKDEENSAICLLFRRGSLSIDDIVSLSEDDINVIDNSTYDPDDRFEFSTQNKHIFEAPFMGEYLKQQAVKDDFNLDLDTLRKFPRTKLPLFPFVDSGTLTRNDIDDDTSDLALSLYMRFAKSTTWAEPEKAKAKITRAKELIGTEYFDYLDTNVFAPLDEAIVELNADAGTRFRAAGDEKAKQLASFRGNMLEELCEKLQEGEKLSEKTINNMLINKVIKFQKDPTLQDPRNKAASVIKKILGAIFTALLAFSPLYAPNTFAKFNDTFFKTPEVAMMCRFERGLQQYDEQHFEEAELVF